VTGWVSYSPQAPGSIFVAFYDSHGYGGIIEISLHVGSLENIMKNINNFVTSL
jgi:hypothetical protein